MESKVCFVIKILLKCIILSRIIDIRHIVIVPKYILE